MAHQFRGSSVIDPASAETAQRRSLAQVFAFVFGATFLLVGIAGFIPGVTTPFEDLAFIGTESDAKLLAVFLVSVFHNIFHMLFAVGIVAAARETWSLAYLIGGGIAYVGLSVYGFAIDENSNFNFPPVNTADNFLHTGLAIGLLGAGLVSLAASKRRQHAAA